MTVKIIDKESWLVGSQYNKLSLVNIKRRLPSGYNENWHTC